MYYGESSSYLSPLVNFKIVHNCLFVPAKDIKPRWCLINIYCISLALKTRLCALLAQGHPETAPESAEAQKMHCMINLWKVLCFLEAGGPGPRELRRRQSGGDRRGEGPHSLPPEPLPTHSPLSAEVWKPVLHRQLKEPSVLTHCPPRHRSVPAHSSTSRIETSVSRTSHGSPGPCAASSGP